MNLHAIETRRAATASESRETEGIEDSVSALGVTRTARLFSIDSPSFSEFARTEERDSVIVGSEARSWIVSSAAFVALVVASAFSGAVYGYLVLGSPDSAIDFFAIGLTAAMLDWGASNVLGAGNARAVSKFETRVHWALSSWAAACAMLLLIVFVLKAGHLLSRGTMLTFFATGVAAVVSVRGYLAPTLVQLTRRAAFRRRSALVIAAERNPTLPTILRSLREAGYDSPVAITIDVSGAPERWPEERRRALDRVASCAKIMKPGEMFLCASGIPVDRLKNLKTGLGLIPRSLFYVPEESVAAVLRGRQIAELGDHVTIEVQREPLSHMERVAKRMIDFVGATVLLVALAPALALVALAVKIDSPGPILFRQARLGLGGRPFDILKFRTMFVTENGTNVRQARRNDARVTRLGRLLRRMSIDELPQLINVIKGEMSLVGPRPHPIALDEEFTKLIENYDLRQHVKPGITGWAQVSGLRGETPTPELMAKRIDADIWYATNASIWLDVRIIVRTAFTVLLERNAY